MKSGTCESGFWIFFYLKRQNNSESLNSLYDKTKFKYRSMIDDAKRKYNDELILNQAHKGKAEWNIINSELGKTSKNASVKKIKSITGVVLSEPTDIANEMNYFFVETPDRKSFIHSYMPPYNSEVFTVNEVTALEVAQAAKSLKNKNSSGPDGFPDFLLKETIDFFIEPLTVLINRSFLTGEYPDALKGARVTPIYKKKGERECLENWRPIAQISSIAKLMEIIIKTRLLNFLEEHKILSSSQHGFLPSKSVDNAALQLTDVLLNSLENNQTVNAIFLDLSKAFQRVNHGLLIHKLYNIGVRGNISAWFESYLHGRVQNVELTYERANRRETVCSKALPVTLGVQQGSILGPLLFVLYINDLPNALDSDLIMYADDTTLLLKEEQLQNQLQLNVILDWFNYNQLTVNASKTTLVNFHGRQQTTIGHDELLLDGSELRAERCVAFLGLKIDDSLSWENHIHSLCKKLSSICFMLRMIRGKISPNMLKTLYFSHFYSRLSYGIAFWGNASEWEKVFKLQKRAVRILHGKERGANGRPISCRSIFKNYQLLTMPSVYIIETVCMMLKFPDSLFTFNEVHSHNTRGNNNFILDLHRTSRYEKKVSYIGRKFFNHLPEELKKKRHQKKFKLELKTFFEEKEYYSAEDFMKDTF